MWRSSAFVALGTFLPLSACTDVAGPQESLTGTWEYSVAIHTGATQCSLGGVTLTIEQQGGAFTGHTSGGTTDCEGGQPQSLANSEVREGTLSGSRVRFFIAGDEVLNEGNLSGNTITGTTTILADGSKLSGTFTMTRR